MAKINIGLIGVLISIIALCVSMKSCNISKKSQETAINSYALSEKIFKIQHTPRLSAQIFGQSYVGKMESRIDEVVTIPIAVFNSSDSFAYNVILDLLISDGTGRQVSLNEYFTSINVPIMRKVRLVPREQWLILPPKAISAPNNSKELYSSGNLKFKAKLQLSWEDADGKQYKSVNLEELKYVKVVDKTTIETFLFESMATFDTISNPKEVEKNWGLNFNY